MRQKCPKCGSIFTHTKEEQDFLVSIAPTFGYKTIDIPAPVRCPACRQRQRLAYGNILRLFKRPCDLTGEEIVSHYSTDDAFKVYRDKEWHSDCWDAREYGREYDFTYRFNDQFFDLMHAVPHPSLLTSFHTNTDSPFTNHGSNNRHCSYIFDSDDNEDCHISFSLHSCKKCIDCYRVYRSEMCYECMDCKECSGGTYMQNCVSCHDSAFLKNCTRCTNCIRCCNLRDKRYYIDNKEATKEEFEKEMKALESRKHLQEVRESFNDWKMRFPQSHQHGRNNINASGDYLTNCINAQHCFDSENLTDCFHVYQAYAPLQHCMDVQEAGDSSHLYQVAFTSSDCHNLYWCCLSPAGNLSDSFYSMYCENSHHLFGCIGIRNREYCIFNKQYTKDEYNKLVPEIIAHMESTGEWGEFLPTAHSPFHYNHTLAQNYYPLTEEQALKRAYKWRKMPENPEQLQGPELPDSITDVDKSILKEHWQCDTCNELYQITPEELKMHTNMNVPLSARCPFCRNERRLDMRTQRKIWDRYCLECQIKITTTYPPTGPEKVYCRECYECSLS